MKLKKKKCKICKAQFEPRNKFQIVCGYKCANEYAKVHLKKEADRKWKTQKKELQEKNKTYGQRVLEARKVFQTYIRLRDKALPCVSCGTEKCRTWQGGHYLKAELFSGLIFDEANCHKQCLQCNFFRDGNETGYREGLVKRYGEDFVKELEARKNDNRLYKYSKEELENIKALYKQKIKNHEQ